MRRAERRLHHGEMAVQNVISSLFAVHQ
jgi:hypothetical protein